MKKVQTGEILTKARNAYVLSDFDRAEKLLLKILPEEPPNPGLLNFMGLVYNGKGDTEKAISCFEDALDIDKRNPEILSNLSHAYKKSGNTKKSLEFMLKAVKQAPGRADFHYNLANHYKQQGEFDKAIDEYNKTVELNGSYAMAYNNLGIILEDRGNYNQARKAYSQGLEADPNNVLLKYNLAHMYERSSEYLKARQLYAEVTAARPDWLPGLVNQGVVLEHLGEYDEAAAVNERILAIDPENPEARNNIGVIMRKQGLPGEAVTYFRAALTRSPEYAKASLNLKDVFEELGSYTEALDEINRLIDIYPDNPEYRLDRGKTLTFLEQYEEAGKDLEYVLEAMPQDIDTLKFAGLLYHKMGKNNQALSVMKKLQKAGSNDPDYFLEIAAQYRQQQSYKEAEQLLKYIINYFPEFDDARMELARLYIDTEHYKHAVKILKVLLGKNPDNTTVLSALVKARDKSGNRDEALHYASKLVSVLGKSDDESDIGELRESLEYFEELVRKTDGEKKARWNEQLSLLASETAAPAEKEQEQTGSLAYDDSVNEEEIPVIDLGNDKEFIAIDETEEELLLVDEEDEPEPEPEENIVHLLDNQDLYPDSRYKEPVDGPAPQQNGKRQPERDDSDTARDTTPRERQEPSPEPPAHTGTDEQNKDRQPYPRDNQPQRHGGPHPAAPPPVYIPVIQQVPMPKAPPQLPSVQPVIIQGPLKPYNIKTKITRKTKMNKTGNKDKKSSIEKELGAALSDIKKEQQKDDTAPQTLPPIVIKTDEEPDADTTEIPIVINTEGEHLTDKSGDDKKPGQGEKYARLFDFLTGFISKNLPEEKNADFLHSEERLKLEAIKRRLLKKHGFKQQAARFDRRKTSRPMQMTRERLKKTIDFIKNLSDVYPDKDIGLALKGKLDKILHRLKGDASNEQ